MSTKDLEPVSKCPNPKFFLIIYDDEIPDSETKIKQLERSIFEKESRLESISRRLTVLENRLGFLSEVSS